MSTHANISIYMYTHTHHCVIQSQHPQMRKHTCTYSQTHTHTHICTCTYEYVSWYILPLWFIWWVKIQRRTKIVHIFILPPSPSLFSSSAHGKSQFRVTVASPPPSFHPLVRSARDFLLHTFVFLSLPSHFWRIARLFLGKMRLEGGGLGGRGVHVRCYMIHKYKQPRIETDCIGDAT